WRTADVAGMTKQERKQVIKMRGIFALKDTEKAALNVEELNQQTKDRVARRFAEAEAAVKNKCK
ncbi:MAG: hypothetical protein RR475_12940, partial [Clostridia bacterium]